jgi:hypothetical protein
VEILATFVFISGINNTGDKLFTAANDTGDEWHQLAYNSKWTRSKNQYMNVKSNRTASQQNKKKLSVWNFFPFIAGVVVTVGQSLLSNITANFRKNLNWSYEILGTQRETVPWKKPEVENLMTDSL